MIEQAMSDVASLPSKHDSLRPVALSAAPSLLDLPPERGVRRSVVATLGATALHVGVLTFAFTLGARTTRHVAPMQVSQLIEVDLPKSVATPEPEPEPEPEAPPPAAVQPVLKPAPPVKQPDPDPSAPTPEQEAPPAPAEAGKLLTAQAPPLDFSNTFVAGNAEQFAGGTTTSDGTSKTKVRATNARSGGVVGGRGNGTPAVVVAPVIDRSRSPQLAGGAHWDCPFPAEADMEQIDQAAVSLEVSVDPVGKVKNVTVKADPGFGFGREARRCALRKTWQPGLNHMGQPTGAVARVKVRFRR